MSRIAIAQRLGIDRERLAEVAASYRNSRCIYATAKATGLSWPTVHMAVFDLRRAGVDLPRKPRRAANAR